MADLSDRPTQAERVDDRIEQVGRSGIYPISGPRPAGPADIRGQGEFGHPEERREQALLPAHRDERAQAALNLIGRAVFGGYFLYNGINHFVNHRMLADMARHKGIPLPDLAVPLTGTLLLGGGLSLLLGKRPRVGTAMIMGFLGTVSPTMHAFWADRDEQERMADMFHFAKNMGLLGGVLLAASLPQPWPVSLDAARRSRSTT